MNNIHDEKFVRNLFDEMSETYGMVNLISSLGFAYFWRKIAVGLIPRDAEKLCDIMSGQGECLVHIANRLGNHVEVDLVDLSAEMCMRASDTKERFHFSRSRVFHCHAQDIPVPDNYYDGVVSTFGMKTLSQQDLRNLADELYRVVKPGGSISILEFSVPQNAFVRRLFMLYVKYYVPFLGRVFLGNPDHYRLLWTYTEKFQNCLCLIPHFERSGFQMQFQSYFLGSATMIYGTKNK